MGEYIGNPKKRKKHILVYAGRLSGPTNENRELLDLSEVPKVALLLIEELEKIGKNPILYIDNDTVNFKTMETIICAGDSLQIDFKSMYNTSIKYNIPYVMVANRTNIKNYCNYIK